MCSSLTGRGRQVVRQRSAKPLSAVRFRPAPPIFDDLRSNSQFEIASLSVVFKIVAACGTANLGCAAFRQGSKKPAQAGVPVLLRIGCSLHFGGAASKLFVLLSRKGLTLGC